VAPLSSEWAPSIYSSLKELFLNFRKGLSVMLGPSYYSDDVPEQYFEEVVELQHRYTMLWPPQPVPNQELIHTTEYIQSDTLACFQSSLSCIYETSAFLGGTVSKAFQGEKWSMIDVGGAEGKFTKELLSRCSTPPQSLLLIEPSPSNVDSYKNLMAQHYPNISLKVEIDFVENTLDSLPKADLIIASHSLYSVLDHDRMLATKVIKKLAERIKPPKGFMIISMASEHSNAYVVKRRVLEFLNRPEISSFGEDVLGLLPKGWGRKVVTVDSFMNVTSILKSDDLLIKWLAYFCRVPEHDLKSSLGQFRTLILDNSMEFASAPQEFRRRYSEEMKQRLNLQEDSRLLFHKEQIIQLYSGRTHFLPG
jgi:phospholipid N-methyltransferase